MENRSCQTNPISFLDEITDLIDKGNGVRMTDSDIWKCTWPHYLNTFHHWIFTAPKHPALIFPVTSSSGTNAITCLGRSGDVTVPHSHIMCDLPQCTDPRQHAENDQHLFLSTCEMSVASSNAIPHGRKWYLLAKFEYAGFIHSLIHSLSQSSSITLSSAPRYVFR